MRFFSFISVMLAVSTMTIACYRDHEDTLYAVGPEDLGSLGTSNCYVVKKAGSFKFKAVKGNSGEPVMAVSAEVLWETWNNAEEPAAKSVIASASLQDGYVFFSTPETIKPGNAVIAARDAGGVIKWSWHIWVPATDISVYDSGIFPTAMMDRNLGALVAVNAGQPSPVEAFGLYYQWGRKDPFVGPKTFNSSLNANVAGMKLTVTDGAGVADESKISLEQSIQRPTLLGHSQNGDWLTPSDATLWLDSKKTIYDPCPPGYRVPPCDNTKPFHSADLSTAPGWQKNDMQYWFALGNPLAFFPFAGYRDDYAPSVMTHSYDRAVYWTARSAQDDVSKADYTNVRSGSAQALASCAKSRAGSVRCVVE